MAIQSWKKGVFRKTFEGGNLLPFTAVGNVISAPAVVAGNLEVEFDDGDDDGDGCIHLAGSHPWLAADLLAVEFVARLSEGTNGTVDFYLGAASATNVDPNAITHHAWFKIQGDGVVLVESDDGTTDVPETSTGITLTAGATDWRRFRIDLASGVVTKGHPLSSASGQSAVQFSISDSGDGSARSGYMRRLDLNTVFSCAGASVLAPYVSGSSAASSTLAAKLAVKEIVAEYRINA